MPKWFSIATEKAILKRSIKVMAIVGTSLMLINHGDRLISNTLETEHIFKIVLTYLVPFSVATYSSVVARLES
ncbi:hypothetical protein SAMN02745127_02882 [Oceanospirillum multiglobuliferum]|uniref:Phosphoenolpyruvate protein kinase n=1 Tax=Oceanospirillum multiglobuliferum TaxID=64969 RepID=A0A1T4SAU2_9GAMM|nr:nitrate/nitrite transporter NrtS [Oceanospirillum multiglobuliferum]OPX54999.1 hypothetical protein BTE48_10885 [Oceanospirillum multiglobuliferum]SKA25216.1 hypothetical protein SAMN02745127_02882 [Oceanospirillum multiglobuliferum]